MFKESARPASMCFPKRVLRVACGSLLLAGALSVGGVLPPQRGRFTSFVPQAPPQVALGDFDGDGRVDVALVQGSAGDRRIAVRLSGSSDSVYLDASVTGVIETDIDHDGDLDLVAATPSGDVLIWLNDGHGRFTRQTASRTRTVSGSPSITRSLSAQAIAFDGKAPIISPPTRSEPHAVVGRARAPAACSWLDARSQILPSPRAPPSFDL